MDVFLVRHAHDLRGTNGDRILSPRGHAQASAVAGRLAESGADELWSSTSTRARQTAAVLARMMRLVPRSDRRIDEIRNDRPEEPGIGPPRERAHPTGRVGVEDWEEFLNRVSAFFSELCLHSSPGRRVVVVTHSGVFDATHEVLTGANRRVELDIAHAGITAWRHRPGSAAGTWLLRWHGDTRHLDTNPGLSEGSRW